MTMTAREEPVGDTPQTRGRREIIESGDGPFQCTCCGHELRNDTCKNPDCMEYGTTYVREGYRVVPKRWADGG